MPYMNKFHSASHPSSDYSFLSSIIFRLVQIGVFLLVALLGSIAIEIIGIATHFWDQPGFYHCEQMLLQEIHYLNQEFKRSIFSAHTETIARQFADWFYDVIFNQSGLLDAASWFITPKNYRSAELYLYAAMMVTQLFAVRLVILLMAMPAYVLLGTVGFIDGFVQRDIRRRCGGRESSYVYHWAKKMLFPLVLLPWILYLSIPQSIHPNCIILPFAVVFSVLVRTVASSFKKYL